MTKNKDDNVNKLNSEIKNLKDTGISIIEERDKIKKELDNKIYELNNIKEQFSDKLKQYDKNNLIKIQSYENILNELKKTNEEIY